MLTLRERIGAVSVLAGVVALTAVNHHPTHGRRLQKDRAAVQAAAGELTHPQIASFALQARLGANAALEALAAAVDLAFVSTGEEGDAVVVTFLNRRGRCIDLISRPGGNTVEDRDC